MSNQITLTFTSTYNAASTFSITFQRVLIGGNFYLDGGVASSNYGGITAINCGGA